MDPVLEEIYSTVLTGAPYVIAAYALVFLILFIYVFMVIRKLSRVEKKVAALEESLDVAGDSAGA